MGFNLSEMRGGRDAPLSSRAAITAYTALAGGSAFASGKFGVAARSGHFALDGVLTGVGAERCRRKNGDFYSKSPFP